MDLKRLLDHGSDYGVHFEYAEQPSPDGFAQAFIIGEKFFGNDSVCLVHGVNIIYGADFKKASTKQVLHVALQHTKTTLVYPNIIHSFMKSTDHLYTNANSTEGSSSLQYTATKTWLNEVSVMRPVLLVLLVSYHAFAPYISSMKAWPLPDGIHQVVVYDWIGLLSRAFLLEGFIFISGYIFTFQLIEKRKFSSLKSLFISKFQRLIIPSFIFSALYILLFLHGLSPLSAVVKIVGGAAHLWYLPCLFWCFLLQYIIIDKDISPKIMAVLLMIAMVISCVSLPLQIGRALYYITFFYGGGYVLEI